MASSSAVDLLADNTDGSSDTRLHSESAQSPYLLPSSSVPLNYNRQERRDSIRSSSSDLRSFTDNDEQPLLDPGSEPANLLKPPAQAAIYGATSSSHSEFPSLESEGARLRSAKTADLSSSTEDSSSLSASEAATKSWWQHVLSWFSALFENLLGVRRTE